MADLSNFSIGCDPEVFVKRRGTSDSKIICAHDLIKGTKKEPFPIKDGAIQVDGMALEFNTEPLNFTRYTEDYANGRMFSRRVFSVMTGLKENLGKDYSIVMEPYHEFDPEYLMAQPEVARELGCDPDMNAYTMQPNTMPEGDVFFRTTAGHIHIGWGKDIPVDHPDHLAVCAQTVKALDAYVGVLSTVLDPDVRRRQLYGKAGAFRPKPYGVEWRTPSNFWIVNDTRRRWMYYAVENVLNKLAQNFEDAPRHLFQQCINGAYSEEEVQRIINEGDTSWARSNYLEADMWSSTPRKLFWKEAGNKIREAEEKL